MSQYGKLTAIYRLESGGAAPQLHSQAQVFLDPNGTSHPTTGPIGGSGLDLIEREDNGDSKLPVNRALVLGPKIYWLQGDSIWSLNYVETPRKADTGAGAVFQDWKSEYNFTSAANQLQSRHLGLYSCNAPTSSGIHPFILTAYEASANNWRGVKYDVNNNSWSETASTNIGITCDQGDGGIKAQIIYDNKLYWIGSNSAGGVGVYDPVFNAVYQMSWGDTNVIGPHDFCAFSGSLYIANRKSSDGHLRIRKVAGNAAEIAAIVPDVLNVDVENNEGRGCLFTDKSGLYCLYWSAGAPSGWGVYEFVATTSGIRYERDVTNLVIIPGTIAKNAGGAQVKGRFTISTEQDLYPNFFAAADSNGHTLTLVFEDTGASGTLFQQYGWTSRDTNWNFEGGHVGIGDGASFHQMARVHTKNGAGERIYNFNGEPSPRVIPYDFRPSASGIMRVKFKVVTNPFTFHNGTPAVVQLRYDTNSFVPYHRGFIRNPSEGTVINNRQLQIVASSGTIYEFDWDLRTDNVPLNNINVALLISTTGVV